MNNDITILSLTEKNIRVGENFLKRTRENFNRKKCAKKALSRERLERPTFGSGVHCATNCANGPNCHSMVMSNSNTICVTINIGLADYSPCLIILEFFLVRSS